MRFGVVLALVSLGPALAAGVGGVRAPAAPGDDSLTHGAATENVRQDAAEQAASLERLARCYSRAGDWARAAAALGRLDQLAPQRIDSNPDLCWLAAEAADRTFERMRAAGALLRCADLFPSDPRRGETLLRAASALAQAGETHAALTLINDSVRNAGQPSLIVDARLARADTLARAGLHDEARVEYNRVWREAEDSRVAASALDRAVDLTIEKQGRTAALLLLAATIRADGRRSGEIARDRFARLAEGLPADIARDPAQAGFLVELARRVGLEASVPVDLQLAAARLREDWGAFDAAAARYTALTDAGGDVGRLARTGQVRCQPRDASRESSDDGGERLAALEREQAWPAISRALQAEARAGAGLDGADRVRGARAALMLGDADAARALLESPGLQKGPGALLRADAAALAGDWSAACADYAAAGGEDLLDAEREWRETRLAVCELRRGDREAARRRLGELLARGTGQPAQFTAERLLAEMAGAASAPVRTWPSTWRPR